MRLILFTIVGTIYFQFEVSATNATYESKEKSKLLHIGIRGSVGWDQKGPMWIKTDENSLDEGVSGCIIRIHIFFDPNFF